ncbi:MAG: helix-turn-helix transcriptional regulator [Planctomycetes bacterium]|nr:helix-turn-helix transcriptional regulator [Planctomycetota bacterium]
MRESPNPPPLEPSLGTKHFGLHARTSAVTVGWYRCAHTHFLRGAEELAPAYTLNFPRRGVYVKHLEGRSLLVDPSSIVFFNRGECWCTSHPYGVGDAGTFVALRHDVVLAIARELEPKVDERPEHVFASSHTTSTPELELAAVELAARAKTFEPIELEERALGLVAASMRRAAGDVGGRELVAKAHRRLAEEARAALVRRAREPLSLDDLALPLGVSIFHLCRVFRSRFGTTMHAELVRQRLALALDELADASTEVGELAHSLGFSSHSHFTRAFRRRFGCTPSEWRARLRSREN